MIHHVVNWGRFYVRGYFGFVLFIFLLTCSYSFIWTICFFKVVDCHVQSEWLWEALLWMDFFFYNVLYRCLFLLVVKYNLLDKDTVSLAEDLTETNVCIIFTLPVFCVVLQDFSFSVNCLNTSCNCSTNKFEFV